MTSNRWQPRRLVRIFLATAFSCAALAAFAPSGARANYNVRECNSSVGNTDAAMIRPFGGATKISQSDNCGNWGLRMEANGQSTYNTYVVWQWTAPPEHHLQNRADSAPLLHPRRVRADDERQRAPGYAARRRPRGTSGLHRYRATAASTRSTNSCFANPCSSTSAFAYITDFYAEVQDLAPPSVERFGRTSRWRGGERGPDSQCRRSLTQAAACSRSWSMSMGFGQLPQTSAVRI